MGFSQSSSYAWNLWTLPAIGRISVQSDWDQRKRCFLFACVPRNFSFFNICLFFFLFGFVLLDLHYMVVKLWCAGSYEGNETVSEFDISWVLMKIKIWGWFNIVGVLYLKSGLLIVVGFMIREENTGDFWLMLDFVGRKKKGGDKLFSEFRYWVFLLTTRFWVWTFD